MKTLKQVLLGVLIAVLIVGFVNAGVGRFDLFSILKLRGCEDGCPDEVIEEISKYPQVVIDTTLLIISANYDVIYTVQIYDDGTMGFTEIMNLRSKE